ncbi:hypothetical protein ACVWXM_004673 [Bradyrhizobium sp. GM7.3]
MIPQTKAVIDMPGQYDKRRLKLDLMVACSLFAAGVVVSGMSLAQIRAETRMQTAQATQPLQGTPSDDQNKPAEAKPGGDPADHARPRARAARTADAGRCRRGETSIAASPSREDRAADREEVGSASTRVLSSSAKADDPVFQRLCVDTEMLRRTGCPACRLR